MNVIEAVFLGLIQGITEFLPVSSSGHLVLFQKFVGIVEHDIIFDVAAHMGTVLAVIIIYKKSLGDFLIPFVSKNKDRKQSFILAKYIIAASIPTAIIGLTFQRFFEGLFSNIEAVGFAFLLTAIVLFFTRSFGGGRKVLDMSQGMNGLSSLSTKKAFLIGCSQALAICPGISRSGMTVASGLFLGVKKETATFFSFLIAIPAIVGALFLQSLSAPEINIEQAAVYLAGFLSSFIFGYAGLKALIQVVKKGNLALFSIYLLALALLCLFYL